MPHATLGTLSPKDSFSTDPTYLPAGEPSLPVPTTKLRLMLPKHHKSSRFLPLSEALDT